MDDLERDLVYRLLTNRAIGVFGASTVFVGTLPQDFPVPLPEGMRVFAPVATPTSGLNRRSNATVHLDAPARPRDFLAELRRSLRSLGWEALPEHGPGRVGFLPAQEQEALHLGDLDAGVSVTAHAADEDGVTRVVLQVSALPPEFHEHLRRMSESERGVPALRVPALVTVHFGGGGGGSEARALHADLETTLGAAALLEHFEPQMSEQGFEVLARTTHGGIGVGVWRSEAGQAAVVTLQPSTPG